MNKSSILETHEHWLRGHNQQSLDEWLIIKNRDEEAAFGEAFASQFLLKHHGILPNHTENEYGKKADTHSESESTYFEIKTFGIDVIPKCAWTEKQRESKKIRCTTEISKVECEGMETVFSTTEPFALRNKVYQVVKNSVGQSAYDSPFVFVICVAEEGLCSDLNSKETIETLICGNISVNLEEKIATPPRNDSTASRVMVNENLKEVSTVSNLLFDELVDKTQSFATKPIEQRKSISGVMLLNISGKWERPPILLINKHAKYPLDQTRYSYCDIAVANYNQCKWKYEIPTSVSWQRTYQ